MPDSYYQVPFDHYDMYGNPVDANGNPMENNGGAGGMGGNPGQLNPGMSGYDDSMYAGADQFGNPLTEGLPDWRIANGNGAAPKGAVLPPPGQFVTYGPGGEATPQPSVGVPADAAPQAQASQDWGGAGGGGGYTGSTGYSANGDGSGLLDPFTQPFNPPAHQNWQDFLPQAPTYTAPTFHAPSYRPPPAWGYKDFQGPDAQTVLSRPGYQFRLNEGERTLQNAKAAQGIMGTGATLKAILGYGQDYASNEFQNEWNRDLGEYNTNRGNSLDAFNVNYGTQYVDPYKFAYQGAMDEFAPKMAEFQANVGAGNLAYSTQAAAAQRQNENDYANAWNNYLFDYNRFRNRQQDTFNMQWPVVQA